MKKHKAIQMKLGKQFNHGGARKGSGRPKGDYLAKTFWISRTTLAMLEAIQQETMATDDGILAASLFASLEQLRGR